jgi:hydroxypyruvate reductase 1
MMVEGFKMNLVYFDLYRNEALEAYIEDYSDLLVTHAESAVTVTRLDTVEDVLREADVVSLHTALNESTHHLVNAQRLALMKGDAILVNTSRGPVIDEAALVEHCRAHPNFKAGLDVFEEEPAMKPNLSKLGNVTIVPHIASATNWTREGMATLAAANVAAMLESRPLWPKDDVRPFLDGDVPQYAPSIVNAAELGLS